ncbi:Monothiol glutaredoxin-S6 [Glycine soja]|uniref:Monothiol glutaredoxin-S6 n=1 Tax=Glycine soja TaxID=3848 RepID=A0A445LEX0_GLYSO|nr:Monothiol glutaredoxin-S6 [Glycine soja]
MDVITSMVAEKPVVIFSKSTCCLSHSMTSLIRSFGANPTVHELDEMANGQQIESALLHMGCQPSVPAVFIGQRFIGIRHAQNLRSEEVIHTHPRAGKDKSHDLTLMCTFRSVQISDADNY